MKQGRKRRLKKLGRMVSHLMAYESVALQAQEKLTMSEINSISLLRAEILQLSRKLGLVK